VPRRAAGRVPTILGTPKDDVLVGTDGNDVIAGLGGDDRIRGRAGNDTLCGGEGSDRLIAGSGDDALYGGRSGFFSDRGGSYYLGDLLRPGPGDDRVDGGIDTRVDEEEAIQDTLDYSHAARGVVLDLSAGTATGEGSDAIVSIHGWSVVGSRFDDSLTGTALSDELGGGRGNDIVEGGGGRRRAGG
jgi:Ca2+-binding RTX toxin-like protein